MSLLVPFFIVLHKYDKRLIYALIAVFLIGGFIMDHFTMHFLLGVIISANLPYLQSPAFRVTRWYRWRHAILGFAFLLFSLRMIDKIVHFGSLYNAWTGYFKIEFFHFSGLASFVFFSISGAK